MSFELPTAADCYNSFGGSVAGKSLSLAVKLSFGLALGMGIDHCPVSHASPRSPYASLLLGGEAIPITEL